MNAVRVERRIDAPVGTVWSVLSDFGAYHEWNPYLVDADVASHENGSGTVTVQPPRGPTRECDVLVTAYAPEHQLAWAATVRSMWLLRCHHSFELAALSHHRTRLVATEEVAGVVPWLVGKRRAARRNESMVAALAARAEAMVHPAVATAD